MLPAHTIPLLYDRLGNVKTTKTMTPQITEINVEKSYSGCLSPYQSGPKKYFFIGVFKFNTGQVIREVLTKPRECYKDIAPEDFSVTAQERCDASNKAYDEYKSVEKALSDPDFAYCRKTSYGVAIYKRDPKSPSGVSNIGGASTMALIHFIKSEANILSPTEGLKSTGMRY
jgi:hypothetical protein